MIKNRRNKHKKMQFKIIHIQYKQNKKNNKKNQHQHQRKN
jgi:hypothetical protein